ncbi:NAD(P)/FAD-dependent oxidoreductase [Candidatus Solirubrobacter pratensis]|uniref:NAD(P)/FAD-dependent oxidoreductase n=1 Tax=Candidatus Solirubrobacter pratensis TaxID=1298857 RepID=UPI00040779E5|nr:FAD-binding oxidoreductase [Candidatus Solirubrobacter pratensis]
MEHSAHGYWLEEAGPLAPVPPLAGDHSADVVVIGGGYAGLWTAWQLRERGASVALLEAEVCGHGPSGRNGGFCETLWTHLPSLVARFGSDRALKIAEASADSVEAIGDWCAEHGVDAWFRRAGYVMASTASAHDAVLDDVLAVAPPGRVVALSPAQVRARCDSPRFRRGIFVPDDATVQPARLALGLRARVREAGVRVHEHSRVKALHASPSGVVAETSGGRVRAGAAVLAINAATRGFPPLRSRVSVTSSHIVLTEPVPEVLEALGWTGGECVTDARTFVHYFRTTPDGRIAFGWGGGRVAPGARLHGRVEVDSDVARTTREHLVAMFPALADRAITHAWGGPIDVSPSHLPQMGTLDGAPVHYVFGFTGNGVGPCHLAGRVLAALAAGEPAPLALVDPAPVSVPPEPLAWVGGSLVRRAFLRKERLEEDDRPVDPLTRAVAAAPRALGIHVAR